MSRQSLSLAICHSCHFSSPTAVEVRRALPSWSGVSGLLSVWEPVCGIGGHSAAWKKWAQSGSTLCPRLDIHGRCVLGLASESLGSGQHGLRTHEYGSGEQGLRIEEKEMARLLPDTGWDPPRTSARLGGARVLHLCG